MSSHRSNLDRRAVLKGAGWTALAASLPVGVSGAEVLGTPTTAAVKGIRDVIAPSGIIPRLRQVRREYEEALEAYRATGDVQAIELLRLHAKNKFGFALGLRARDEAERSRFREAGALLEELETKFPELPMSGEMKARYAKLRAWAEEGGQSARSVARWPARRDC
jgi:hypothetical protein